MGYNRSLKVRNAIADVAFVLPANKFSLLPSLLKWGKTPKEVNSKTS